MEITDKSFSSVLIASVYRFRPIMAYNFEDGTSE